MINIKRLESGDRIVYKDKTYKVVKCIGYYDNVIEKLKYDYILFDGENAIAVSESDIVNQE